jgi:ribonuclease P protein component
MRLRPEQHVRRQHDFRDAREKGRRFDCGGFTFWYHRRPSPSERTSIEPLAAAALRETKTLGPRVAVIASTAAVGGAVQRNRAKRRLREVFRQQQQLVPAEYDLLLVAKRSLNALAFSAIEQRFVDACRRVFHVPKS